jgi:hypothetical protein
MVVGLPEALGSVKKQLPDLVSGAWTADWGAASMT